MLAKLSANQEDYLEVIAAIIKEKGAARVKDVAARLQVTGASVNGAMRALSESGYVQYTPYESLRLTKKGAAYAARVSGRHAIVQRFLTEVLLVEESEAIGAACCMEHTITDLIAEKFRILTEHIQDNDTNDQKEWRQSLKAALGGGLK